VDGCLARRAKVLHDTRMTFVLTAAGEKA